MDTIKFKDSKRSAGGAIVEYCLALVVLSLVSVVTVEVISERIDFTFRIVSMQGGHTFFGGEGPLTTGGSGY
jgi:hypothetical protein